MQHLEEPGKNSRADTVDLATLDAEAGFHEFDQAQMQRAPELGTNKR